MLNVVGFDVGSLFKGLVKSFEAVGNLSKSLGMYLRFGNEKSLENLLVLSCLSRHTPLDTALLTRVQSRVVSKSILLHFQHF